MNKVEKAKLAKKMAKIAKEYWAEMSDRKRSAIGKKAAETRAKNARKAARGTTKKAA